MPDGRWVTTHRLPFEGVTIFDPSGVEVLDFATPEVANPRDVVVFADGTIGVVDSQEGVDYYTPLGVHVGSISIAGTFLFGAALDANEELWVCGLVTDTIAHVTRDGTLLGSIATGDDPADLDFAPDGTLWVLIRTTGEVRNYTRDGALLSSFSTPTGSSASGIGVASDGTLWVTGWNSTELRHYDSTGALLGTIGVPSSSVFLTVRKGTIGSRYCSPAVPNSTGLPGRLTVAGSSAAAVNDVTLLAEDLPPGEFGYFLVGSNQGQAMPPGSQGVICLVCGFHGCGGIGRYNQGGSIILGPTGSLTIDLTSLPLSPPVAVVAGDVWNFQCWYRDLGSSNFTDAVSVLFH